MYLFLNSFFSRLFFFFLFATVGSLSLALLRDGACLLLRFALAGSSSNSRWASKILSRLSKQTITFFGDENCRYCTVSILKKNIRVLKTFWWKEKLTMKKKDFPFALIAIERQSYKITDCGAFWRVLQNKMFCHVVNILCREHSNFGCLCWEILLWGDLIMTAGATARCEDGFYIWWYTTANP